MPIDRRMEQKLWDAFRKPIDDAFGRKTAEREKAEMTLGARDKAVLTAAKALEAANASGDAQAIRAVMAGLDAALHGQAQAQADFTGVADRYETDVAGRIDDGERRRAGQAIAPENFRLWIDDG